MLFFDTSVFFVCLLEYYNLFINLLGGSKHTDQQYDGDNTSNLCYFVLLRSDIAK